MKANFNGLLILVFILISSLSLVLAHTGDSDSDYCMMDWFNGGGMMGGYGSGLFGFVIMILIIVALILFIIWLIKQIQKPNKK